MNLLRFDSLRQTVQVDVSLASVLDIALVAVAVYYLLLLVRGTRAIQLLKGVAVLLVLVGVSRWAGLDTFHWLMTQMLLPGVIALIILFQPELRLALERLGRGRLWPGGATDLKGEEVSRLITEIVRAARQCAQSRVGALIVLEREVGLNDIIRTGKRVDGVVSTELLRTVFFPGSPLHDGAAVIRDDRVVAAGCVLPLSERYDVGALLGTRHRAALGLCEQTDAAVVIVSEESGAVSYALEGRLFTNLADDALRKHLVTALVPPERERPLTLRRKAEAAPKP
ncbi:MAG: diadenylate cyclase CdaA [Armatimonadota bacterium]|nr:MAG: diadenylate cyclase CdaA [Armatimonadota bacterium]